MKRIVAAALMAAFVGAGLAGCSTAPKTEGGREALRSESRGALQKMEDKYPGLRDTVQGAYAYAVFPSVAKGAVIVGGASGQGEVFQNDQLIGYARLNQATVGASLGGQEFSEVLLFQNKNALDNFKYGSLKFQAGASAVALKAGAATAANYQNGVAVFVESKGGLMVDASIGGQDFTFKPVEDAGGAPNAPPPAAPNGT